MADAQDAGKNSDLPDPPRADGPGGDTERATSTHPSRNPRTVWGVLVFTGVFAVFGFKLGLGVYNLAGAGGQPSSEALFHQAARIALLGGTFMGLITALALVPGLEANVFRALTPRALLQTAIGGVGGAALCLATGGRVLGRVAGAH